MTAPVAWTPWRPPQPEHPRASTALVLGIVSMGGLIVLLPFVLGPIAWYLGVRTLRDMDREPERWSGRSSARAGLVLGVISSGLLVLVLVVGAMLVAGIAVINGYDSGYPT